MHFPHILCLCAWLCEEGERLMEKDTDRQTDGQEHSQIKAPSYVLLKI